MSYHFMAHTKRMEQAGIFSVRLTLGGLDAKGNRLMVVTPHESVPAHLDVKFPPRTFEIDGTDRMLQTLIDDMVYIEGGPTPEMLQAAVNLHPLARADLLEWYADWLLNPPDADEDDADAPAVDEGTIKRTHEYVKGLLRGHAAHRKAEARKA